MSNWRIRLAATLIGMMLVASVASAANTEQGSRGEPVGSCDSMCQGSVGQSIDAPYPAYQPLQVCNIEVCVFY